MGDFVCMSGLDLIWCGVYVGYACGYDMWNIHMGLRCVFHLWDEFGDFIRGIYLGYTWRHVLQDGFLHDVRASGYAMWVGYVELLFVRYICVAY